MMIHARQQQGFLSAYNGVGLAQKVIDTHLTDERALACCKALNACVHCCICFRWILWCADQQ